jgi:hypothetical protein
LKAEVVTEAARADARRATARDERTGAAATKADAADARSSADLQGMAALAAATRPLGADRLAGAAARAPSTMLLLIVRAMSSGRRAKVADSVPD